MRNGRSWAHEMCERLANESIFLLHNHSLFTLLFNENQLFGNGTGGLYIPNIQTMIMFVSRWLLWTCSRNSISTRSSTQRTLFATSHIVSLGIEMVLQIIDK